MRKVSFSRTIGCLSCFRITQVLPHQELVMQNVHVTQLLSHYQNTQRHSRFCQSYRIYRMMAKKMRNADNDSDGECVKIRGSNTKVISKEISVQGDDFAAFCLLPVCFTLSCFLQPPFHVHLCSSRYEMIICLIKANLNHVLSQSMVTASWMINRASPGPSFRT